MTDLLGAIRLHHCLTRLWDLMQANPLSRRGSRQQQPQQQPNGGHWGSNGGLGALGARPSPFDSASSGSRQNGWLAQGAGSGGGVGGHRRQSGLAWVLPGCGEAWVQEVGLECLVLAVAPPPPLPDNFMAGQPPLPLRLTVRWASRYGSQGNAAVSAACVAAAAASPRHVRNRMIECGLSAEPALPAPVLAALAAQLEAGSEKEFLDALCIAGHSAAAVQQRLLANAAQRGAGCLPGVLTPAAPPLASSSSGGGGDSTNITTSATAAPTPYRLAYRLQQAGRSLHLTLHFAQAGFTLLRLSTGPASEPGTAAWSQALWSRLQRLPGYRPLAPSPASIRAGDKPGGQQPAAWVHLESLPAALRAIMEAVVGAG